MIKLLTSAAAAAFALALSSCYYDPYYSGGSASVGYSSYGGGGSSTSVFISTGDPRWGYSPYYRAYYDYHRRAYYDPYLYGYYPVGYLPPVVYGVPHPHGWRQGMRHCPPPSRIRTTTLHNYRHRSDAYRRSNFGWSRNVRQTAQGRQGSPPARTSPGNFNRRNDFRDSRGTPQRFQDNDRGRNFNRDSRNFDRGSSAAPQRRSGFTPSQPVRHVTPDRSTRAGRTVDAQQRFGNQPRRDAVTPPAGRSFDRSQSGRQFQRPSGATRESVRPQARPSVRESSGRATRSEGGERSERSERARQFR
ncbi:MAG: hypothetical protein QM627_13445 [Luteolibacter sp.]